MKPPAIISARPKTKKIPALVRQLAASLLSRLDLRGGRTSFCPQSMWRAEFQLKAIDRPQKAMDISIKVQDASKMYLYDGGEFCIPPSLSEKFTENKSMPLNMPIDCFARSIGSL